jgi:hypothetical protein
VPLVLVVTKDLRVTKVSKELKVSKVLSDQQPRKDLKDLLHKARKEVRVTRQKESKVISETHHRELKDLKVLRV